MRKVLYVPQDGTITRINDVYTKDNGTLRAITIENNNNKSKLYYVKPKNYIKVGTKVKKADIIGNTQSLSKESPIRHGGDNPTPNHVHQEVHINNEPQNPLKYINNQN